MWVPHTAHAHAVLPKLNPSSTRYLDLTLTQQHYTQKAKKRRDYPNSISLSLPLSLSPLSSSSSFSPKPLTNNLSSSQEIASDNLSKIKLSLLTKKARDTKHGLDSALSAQNLVAAAYNSLFFPYLLKISSIRSIGTPPRKKKRAKKESRKQANKEPKNLSLSSWSSVY